MGDGNQNKVKTGPHRWGKGESGNPGGRPKNPFSLRKALAKWGEMVREIEVDGKVELMSNLDAMMLQVWTQAVQGNPQAYNFIAKVGAVYRLRHEGAVRMTGISDAATLTDEERAKVVQNWRDLHPELFNGSGKRHG